MLKRSSVFSSRRVLQNQMMQQLPTKPLANLTQVQSNTKYTRIHQLVQNPFGDNPTLLFSMPIIQNPAVRKRYIVFKSMNYLISNWTADDFPNVIYVCLKDFTGYAISKYTVANTSLRSTLVESDNRVAALELDQVTASFDQSKLRTYQLKYTLKDVVNWQLPLSLDSIDLSIKIDGSSVAQTLPLPNPLILNVQIRQDK